MRNNSRAHIIGYLFERTMKECLIQNERTKTFRAVNEIVIDYIFQRKLLNDMHKNKLYHPILKEYVNYDAFRI
jgi:hypothetical protein